MVNYFGKPTIKNYNDWEQCNSFLKYGNKLYVSRASNVNASTEEILGLTVTSDVSDSSTIPVSDVTLVKIGQYIAFGSALGPVKVPYEVLSVDAVAGTLTIDRNTSVVVADDAKVYDFKQALNSVFEVQEQGSAVVVSDYLKTQLPIGNYADFEIQEQSIAMNSVEAKAKFIARSPGVWGNSIEIAIAKASDFGVDKMVFEGIALDDLFMYSPTGDEVGIIIRNAGVIQETFTVSFDPDARDENNKSMYIEDVINNKSLFVFVKDNTANENPVMSCLYSDGNVISLVKGIDSPVGFDDLINAYDLWSNKEAVDKLCA